MLERAGGRFTREQLGDYLDVLESLADMEARKLVSIDDIDDWYGSTIATTYRHPEVLAFIREERQDDAEYYTGFEDLGRRIAARNRPGTTIMRPAQNRP